MDQILAHLPVWAGILALVGTFTGLTVAGGLAVIGITDKKARERKAEDEKSQESLQDRIKSLSQEAMAAQDEKIKVQSQELKDMGDRVIVLETENTMLKKILLGTDEKSVAYRSRVEATLLLVDQLAKIIELNGKKTDAILDTALTIVKLANETNNHIEKLVSTLATKI